MPMWPRLVGGPSDGEKIPPVPPGMDRLAVHRVVPDEELMAVSDSPSPYGLSWDIDMYVLDHIQFRGQRERVQLWRHERTPQDDAGAVVWGAMLRTAIDAEEAHTTATRIAEDVMADVARRFDRLYADAKRMQHAEYSWLPESPHMTDIRELREAVEAAVATVVRRFLT